MGYYKNKLFLTLQKLKCAFFVNTCIFNLVYQYNGTITY